MASSVGQVDDGSVRAGITALRPRLLDAVTTGDALAGGVDTGPGKWPAVVDVAPLTTAEPAAGLAGRGDRV